MIKDNVWILVVILSLHPLLLCFNYLTRCKSSHLQKGRARIVNILTLLNWIFTYAFYPGNFQSNFQVLEDYTAKSLFQRLGRHFTSDLQNGSCEKVEMTQGKYLCQKPVSVTLPCNFIKTRILFPRNVPNFFQDSYFTKDH